MKKAFLVFVSLALLAGAVSVFAEDASPLPTAGATPDNPLYFFKTIKEKIQTIFTFNTENKVKQYLHLADIRLAEYQRMLEKGKEEVAQRILEKYQAQIDRAIAIAKKLQAKKQLKEQSRGEDLDNKIQERVANHVQVLQDNISKAPDSAKKGLNNALERANKLIKNHTDAEDEADEESEANGQGETDKEDGCVNSGGRVVVSSCCKLAEDFPSMCLIGACGCSPDNSEETEICDCGPDKCFDGKACVVVGQ